MLRRTSQLRHISFIEFNELMNTLVERVSDLRIDSINPLDSRDLIPAAFLAQKLGVIINYQGTTTFSIYNDKLPTISIFAKNHQSDLYNNKDNRYYEEIDVEEDGYHQQVTFEWEK